MQYEWLLHQCAVSIFPLKLQCACSMNKIIIFLARIQMMTWPSVWAMATVQHSTVLKIFSTTDGIGNKLTVYRWYMTPWVQAPI